VDERDARAEVANRARELMERYGLGEEYRLVQETHGRHLGSGVPQDFENYRAALNNLLVQLAVLAFNEGREGRRRYT
jgi:hypothetical protein